MELRRRTVRRGLLHVRVHVDLGRAHVGGEKANVVAAQDRKRTRIFMEMPRNTPYRSDVESNVEMWCQRRRQAVMSVADAMAQSTVHVCTARRRAFSPPRARAIPALPSVGMGSPSKSERWGVRAPVETVETAGCSKKMQHSSSKCQCDERRSRAESRRIGARGFIIIRFRGAVKQAKQAELAICNRVSRQDGRIAK